jgi:hypothetical protein
MRRGRHCRAEVSTLGLRYDDFTKDNVLGVLCVRVTKARVLVFEFHSVSSSDGRHLLKKL